MGHVQRERSEVDIPVEAYLNHFDGRVFIIGRTNHRSRITIQYIYQQYNITFFQEINAIGG